MEGKTATPKSSRAFELAKELGVSSKAILEHLKTIGMPAKSAIGVLTPVQVGKAVEYFTTAKPAAPKPAAPAPKPAAAPKAVEAPAAPAKPAAAPAAAKPAAAPKAGETSPAPAAKPAAVPAPTAEKKPVVPAPAAKPVVAAPVEAKKEEPAPAPPPPPPPVVAAPPPPPPPPVITKTYTYERPVTLAELAKSLDLKGSEMIKALLAEKMMVTLNQNVGFEIIEKIAPKFSFKVVRKDSTHAPSAARPSAVVSGNLKPRSPVVTIMGHVDHGKTSLLDAIRKTDVAGGEAGGITQHIGAYKISLPGKGQVVFLDTPGHEAFTALRARGARVTDVVVLVVAGDDGVMPQTEEAIDHAKAAGVPIVVAINKMDKPEANPQRVMQELSDHGLVPEQWGGKTIMVECSARKKTGLDKLLEMLLLEAELLELKADPEAQAEGIVLEAKMHPSRGPVATVLISNGTLHNGDIVVCGGASGRVRMMHDDHGHAMREAGPATPVELLGLASVPESGTVLTVAADDREARDKTQVWLDREKERRRQRHITLQDLSMQVKEGAVKELRMILKADVQGSLEALTGYMTRLANEKVQVTVIHGGVGKINRSDIALAAASDAVIIGFNTDGEPGIDPIAQQEGVEIRTYKIIFEAIDEIKKAMEGLLEPKVELVSIGRVEVRKTFRTPKGTVAGCFVISGKAVRGEKIRVSRAGQIVHEGTLSSLRRIKDDAREVAAGYECGINLEKFDGWQNGDIIEVFTEQVTKDKLSF
jgi:translation initiation factor IF-2